MLARPKPPEGACGQQAIDESIDDFLQGDAPGLAFPNAIAQVSEAVGQKRRSASNTEYHPIVGAGCDGAPRKIRDEEADDQRIGKPLPQELWHGGRSAGK